MEAEERFYCSHSAGEMKNNMLCTAFLIWLKNLMAISTPFKKEKKIKSLFCTYFVTVNDAAPGGAVYALESLLWVVRFFSDDNLCGSFQRISK